MVVRGSPAILHCRYSSHPYDVRWWRNGVLLNLDLEQQNRLLLPDGSLFLLTTRMEDTGRYQCEVTTEEGIFDSKEALLTVFDNQKIEVFHFVDDEVILEKSEENNSIEVIDEEDSIVIEMISNVPEIVDSYLLTPITGFIKWTSPTPSDVFILLLQANNSP